MLFRSPELNLRTLLRAAEFVPESKGLNELLREFRSNRSHMAIVIDEFGRTAGLITIEDVLEEIVGEISDEYDVAASGIRPQADGSFVVDGTTTIRDLNRRFEWNLPDDEATTIAGLVLHEAQMIPDAGQVFTFYGFRDRKSTRLNSSHSQQSRMPSSA